MAYSLQEKQDLEALGPNQKCKKKKMGSLFHKDRLQDSQGT